MKISSSALSRGLWNNQEADLLSQPNPLTFAIGLLSPSYLFKGDAIYFQEAAEPVIVELQEWIKEQISPCYLSFLPLKEHLEQRSALAHQRRSWARLSLFPGWNLFPTPIRKEVRKSQERGMQASHFYSLHVLHPIQMLSERKFSDSPREYSPRSLPLHKVSPGPTHYSRVENNLDWVGFNPILSYCSNSLSPRGIHASQSQPLCPFSVFHTQSIPFLQGHQPL